MGSMLGGQRLRAVKAVHSYLDLGAWVRGASPGPIPDHANRDALFAEALTHVTGVRPLYLEFGVFEGESLRWWSEHLAARDGTLVGFDSFEGLPENWKDGRSAGHFATQVPQIDDHRVSFEVGWFEDTVPTFELPPHDQLIVNIDCDLYSSTSLVLHHLEPALTPGTLIYFDEFSDRDHEFRAFREYLDRTGGAVRALGTTQAGIRWLFEVTG